MIRQKLLKTIQIGGCVSLLVLSGGVSAGSGCEGDQKIEGSGPHTYTPGHGYVVTGVCIKADRNVITVPCNAQPNHGGCYDVHWSADGYCSSVTISQLVYSRDCKSISHTAAHFEHHY